MRLSVDTLHRYNIEAVCHVRVWHETGWLPVVIAGELGDNPGTSVTNAIERIIEDVDRLLSRSFTKGEYVLIEHYPPRGVHPPTWDRIEMKDGCPSWHHLKEDDVRTLLDGKFPEVWEAGTYTTGNVA